MAKPKSTAEPSILSRVRLRPLLPEEPPRFDQLLQEPHYLTGGRLHLRPQRQRATKERSPDKAQGLSRPQSVENAPDRGQSRERRRAEAPDKAQGQLPRCNTTPQPGQMKCPCTRLPRLGIRGCIVFRMMHVPARHSKFHNDFLARLALRPAV
jgi:hypothetical protein